MNRIAALFVTSCFLLSEGVGAETSSTEPAGTGSVFRDCDACPEMVVIPSGIFEPGSKTSRAKRDSDKGSQIQVDVRSFALGRTEVTQGQWKVVMGRNPSRFSECGDDCPVERVSWKDAQEFIRRINAMTGKVYRLPSNVEWEYACQAGKATRYCGGEQIYEVAWYETNSKRTTHLVASKRPNAWGLYDMTGNVWEWTQDCDSAKSQSGSNTGNVSDLSGCKKHSLRGGSWGSFQQLAQTAQRSRSSSKNRAYDVVSRRSDFGLRLAATLP